MTPPSDEGRSVPENASPGAQPKDPSGRHPDEAGLGGPEEEETTGEGGSAEPAALDTLLTALRARLPPPSSDPPADEAGRPGESSTTADSS